MENKNIRKKYRGGFVGPILLVTAGFLLLLNNLNLLQGSFWETAWKFWPFLFIAIGLESLILRKKIAGPVFMITVSVVILLSNLGYFFLTDWMSLWRLWPVLLIAIGVDIIIGRRSWWASLSGGIITIIAIAAVLFLAGTWGSSGKVLNDEIISVNIGSSQRAVVTFSQSVGEMNLDNSQDAHLLIQGRAIARNGGGAIIRDSYISGDTLHFTLRSQIGLDALKTSGWQWDLNLSDTIPMVLNSNMGAGELDLDLDGLLVEKLNVDQGVGAINLVLPSAGRYRVTISQAIGQITVRVPNGIGLRIDVDKAISDLKIPAGLVKSGRYYISPGFESAENSIDLQIDQAIGSIKITY